MRILIKAFFVGMVIAKFGPAWGLGIGVGLYLLLLTRQMPGLASKQPLAEEEN